MHKVSFLTPTSSINSIGSVRRDCNIPFFTQKLDQGNKGYLTFKDLKTGFQAMNYQISDSAIRDMIAVASDDGDDQVSIEGEYGRTVTVKSGKMLLLRLKLHDILSDIWNFGRVVFGDAQRS